MSTQDQSAASDAPAIVSGITFPKLSIRNTAVLCKEYQASQGRKLRELVNEEEMTAEAKVKFLALTIAGDFGLGHLWDWALTAEGSEKICVKSLVQGGMSSAEATEHVTKLSGAKVQEAAMEIVDHDNSPTRIIIRKAEYEAKQKEKEARKASNQPGVIQNPQ
jgi:hypothetical protein